MDSILFIAADPSDASRLRIGEEAREIQEKLQLSKWRDSFELHLRLSARAPDISQALLNITPQIVHFSGHGTGTGALCFENQVGETQLVTPEALAALFAQFKEKVKCVVLNACFSEKQAEAISAHIKYVVGMNQAIGDKAAIAFSIGFYQAIGAGRSIEDAYNLGCVQIRLNNIPEHLTPVLIKKTNQFYFVPESSKNEPSIELKHAHNDTIISVPLSQFRKHTMINGWTGTGKTTTLNFLTKLFWEKHNIPFFAIKHWQGIHTQHYEKSEKFKYYFLEDSSERKTKDSPLQIINDENALMSRLSEIQNNIRFEYLRACPTILDIKLKNWSLTDIAFKQVWLSFIQSLTSDYQSDELQMIVVIDELPEIGMQIDYTELSKHFDILRRCGVGVLFSGHRFDWSLLRHTRNFIIFPRSDILRYNLIQELKSQFLSEDLELLLSHNNESGIGLFLAQGVISPTLISISKDENNIRV